MRIRKIFKKKSLFDKTEKKYFIYLFFAFLGLEDPQKPKNKQPKYFFSALAKSDYFFL